MTGKTHQIIGIGVGLGSYLAQTTPQYGPATFAGVLIMASIGSLLPDLDRASAKIWTQLPYGKLAGRVVDPFITHRNFSHSILGVALFGLGFQKLFSFAPEYWGLNHGYIMSAFLIGFVSHILADMVTVQGVPLLFPYKRMFGIPPKPFDGIRIVTGQWFENLIIFPVVNLALIALLIDKWDVIHQILFQNISQ